MDGIFVKLSRAAKRSLEKLKRRLTDANHIVRVMIVLKAAEKRSPTEISRSLSVSRSTVYKAIKRFREGGIEGLADRRLGNGALKLDEDYLQALYEVVSGTPPDYGWPRPTWTQELLVLTLHACSGTEVSPSTMSRALSLIGARRGRPKPVVACPWSKRRKNRHLAMIREVLDELDGNEVAYFEDEVDIHLNPKIGVDWMVPGQQKEVMTPGKNQKRYIAGALNAETKELVWVSGEKKNTHLFYLLLEKLLERHPRQVIHVILDNYVIHKTLPIKDLLCSEEGRRIHLHFLPPYCPDYNRIERVWQDLHANVTRNHKCQSISELMRNVQTYLNCRNQDKSRATLAA